MLCYDRIDTGARIVLAQSSKSKELMICDF